jgi:uncharacterized protein YlxW (UPF0749 family)
MVSEIKLQVSSLQEELTKEKNKLENFEDSEALEKLSAMNSKIEELDFYNGFTDVRGPGIMIRVSDSTSDDVNMDIMEKIVHDVDITVLLNDLKNAGAEAIDVNGKRIINISEVVCAGPILRINGSGVSAPFVIRAVGDPESLYNAVTEEGTYAYNLKNTYGMEVATIMSYNLPSIPQFYGDNYEIHYAQAVENINNAD